MMKYKNTFRLLVFGITIYLFLQIPLSAQVKNVNSFVSQEQVVNGFSNVFLGVNYSEPYIATNPRDSLNTICSFIYGSYYTLDGLNWSSISSLNSSDPFLTFDSLGNAYYAPAPPWNSSNLSVRKSTDKGVTWNYNYQITNNQTDKPCICGNQSGGIYSNYLYTAWQNYPYGLFFARSVNQGANWSSMSLNVPENYYCPYLAIGPSATTTGGIVYYGFNNFDSQDNIDVRIRKSTDAGITFSPDILAVPLFPHPSLLKGGNIEPNACIQMAADNSYGAYRGNVYIVYTGKGTGNDNADIFFVKSTNYGNNWSSPLKLNDDNTINDQWMPAISVANNGKIYIVWYDSRIDPQNYMTLLYGTVSTNGGATFATDFPVSTTPFNPALMAQSGFMGHYISVSAAGNSAIASWTDGRNNNFGSYVGYLPDFAMTATPAIINVGSNDSVTAVIKIPSIKGPYAGNIKFTYTLDSLPLQGNISINFLNKDSITSIPDSLYMKIKLTNVNVPRRHRITVTGRNTTYGAPVHSRTIDLMVNSSILNIGTNRIGAARYKVNGTQYTTQQSFIFINGTNVTVQAISPVIAPYNSRYVFANWSDAGDTTHSFVINTNTNLTAFYKTQFKMTLLSSVGNSFGGNTFYDSLQPFTFGVYSKVYVNNNQVYVFKGWDGYYGNGSYTSPDSSGNDTIVNWTMSKSIIEEARWIPVTGVSHISFEIPKEYKLYNAYPNPFNPSTKIKYDLPKNGLVKLSIYDALGREIETLVNMRMDAGTYVVDFNGSKLASGVYFCRLQSNDFINIKRMVLLK